MPRVIGEELTRLVGGEHVCTDQVDTAQCKAYEDRSRGRAGKADAIR